MSNRMNRVVCMLGACGVTCPVAMAQDSISSNNVPPNMSGAGLPGDALSPYDADQCRAYVVDLVGFRTSRDNVFGIAPIMKTSKSSSQFFGSLMSAQAISPDLDLFGAVPATSYAVWENAPGFGVNAAQNFTPGTVTPPANSIRRFGVAAAEFGTNNGDQDYNGIVGGIVNYFPGNVEANRLWVYRLQAAVNGNSLTSGDTAQFGIGAIDAAANLYYRADNFGINPNFGQPGVAGNNYFRTNLDVRDCTVTNLISGNAATADATDFLLTGSGITHVVPGVIAESAIGAPGAISGSNFNNQWVRGTAAPLTADSSHLTGLQARGAVSSTESDVLGSGIWTHAMLNVNAIGTRQLSVWSVGNTLSVVEQHGFDLPNTVSDTCDPFTLDTTLTPSIFTGYFSQTPFRGGTGQVAIGEDQQNRGLAAATISEFDFSDDPFNHIAVVRFNEDGTGATWALAAWIDALSGTGKPIRDALGAAVGQLTPLSNVTGGTPLGPSLSQPHIDAAGNIWFIGAVELFNRIDTDGDTIPDASDFDSALIRAIYDPVDFCYTLEKVLELGDVFAGANSGRNYQIQFLSIADSNSLSSSSFFSGNGRSTAWDDANIAGLSTEDPFTTGGIVLFADIVYDVDGDGMFQDPTSGACGCPNSVDESYQTLLYVGKFDQGCNVADYVAPFGVIDFFDVSEFNTLFAAMDPRADLAAPFGVFDFFDQSAFLNAVTAGCP